MFPSKRSGCQRAPEPPFHVAPAQQQTAFPATASPNPAAVAATPNAATAVSAS